MIAFSSRSLVAAIFILTCAPLLGAEGPSRDEILNRIQQAPSHPRLFWTKADEAAVREKIATDAQMKAVWEAVQVSADHMLNERPVVYRKDGRRLLGRSREALGRMMHLGCAYRLTQDKRYLERGVAEMKAMADMQDWNPSHFLDTAEMTLAMAVGYDWLYPELTPEIKSLAKKAIESKGLNPYLQAGSRHGWERGGNNWNQVCHAGMIGGALALLEDNPERAAEVVDRALQGLPNAMKVYNPDGTYPEGPGYWNYGTTFNVMLISMLESVLRSDFGVSQSPGFLKSGDFMLNIMGPSGRTYNFSDCGTGTGFSPAMTWFAARAGRQDWLWFETGLLKRELQEIQESRGRKQGDRYFPLVLVWADSGLERKQPAALNWLGQGQNPIAVLRSSWTDPNAVYVGIKAGTPSASHGHMDIGSFVMDAEGVRWSLDLGMQDYNGLEQRGLALWDGRQGAERWKVFRYHNRAHSTLLIDDAEQVVSSRAPIAEFSPDPQSPYAVVDMTETYAGQVASAKRKFSLKDRVVTIEDRLKGGSKPGVVRWAMVTPAELKVEGPGRAWLEQSGKKLLLEVVSPREAKIELWPANPPPRDHDAPNPGVGIVGFHAPIQAGKDLELVVRLRPAGE